MKRVPSSWEDTFFLDMVDQLVAQNTVRDEQDENSKVAVSVPHQGKVDGHVSVTHEGSLSQQVTQVTQETVRVENDEKSATRVSDLHRKVHKDDKKKNAEKSEMGVSVLLDKVDKKNNNKKEGINLKMNNELHDFTDYFPEMISDPEEISRKKKKISKITKELINKSMLKLNATLPGLFSD